MRIARTGLTLVELLVALLIVGVIAALALPAILRVRERANELACQNNLRQLVVAVHSHHSAKGKMPPYASGRPGEIHGGWFVHLLPYTENTSTYQAFVAGQKSESNGVMIATEGLYSVGVQGVQFPFLCCLSDPSRSNQADDSLTNYVGNWYALGNGVRGSYGSAQRFDGLTNGLSSTVLFAEAYSQCDGLNRLALLSSHYHNFGITQQGKPSDDPLYLPNDYTMFQVCPDKCDKWRAQTPHAAMPVAMADGTVRTIALSVSPETWRALLKSRSGVLPGNDWQ